jgi:L-iditol 2-dehydrogenase
MTSLTAVLTRPGEIVLEERPEPRPGLRDVIVAVDAVGVCGSDVHYYRHGRLGPFVVEAPLVLGHEAAGTVVAAGADAAHPVGTRVAIEPGVPCRRCRLCRAGSYHLCRDIRFLATPPVDGAFTRLLAVPDDFAYPLPEQLDAEQGALLEPLSVGIWACRRAGLRPGDRVLVSGAGPVGLLAAEAALALGAAGITVAEVTPTRLATASLRRVDAVVDAAGGLELPPAFDVLLECSGAPGALSDALRCLAPGGRAAVVGLSAQAEIPLPLGLLHDRELTVSLVFRYAHTWPTAIALAASGRVDLAGLVSHRFGLAEAEQALAAGTTEPDLIKAMVLPSRETARETAQDTTDWPVTGG